MTENDFLNSSSRLVREAYEIAKVAHKGQFDKAGAEYIGHPMTVASYVIDDEICTVVALLHDTIEDTDVTLEYLQDIFPGEVIAALRLLTHRKEVPYMDYVKAIKESGNAVAIRVKLADLRNNMDLSRIPEVTEKDIKRLNEKYIPAKEYLEA